MSSIIPADSPGLNPFGFSQLKISLPSISIVNSHTLDQIKSALSHLSTDERQQWANSKDEIGKTPLALAVEVNNINIVEFLVEICKADPNIGDKDNWTPLYRASDGTHSKCLKYLLEHGANPNICNTDANSSPLHRIVIRGSIEDTFSLLSAGANVNALNVLGTPLYYAARKGYTEIISLLLNLEKKPNFEKADPNLVNDPLSFTPAAIACNEGTRKILLRVGGMPLIAPDSKVHTNLSRLVHEGKDEAILETFKLNEKDSYGRSAAHYCSALGKLDLLKQMRNFGNIDQPDNDKHTPLHWAVIKGQKAVVEFLISEKGDCNLLSLDKRDNSILMLACEYKQVDIARQILERSKDKNKLEAIINQKNKYSWLPIHKAAESSNVEMVELLVDQFGADPTVELKDGQTPLSFAEKTDSLLLIELLRKAIVIFNNHYLFSRGEKAVPDIY